VKVQFVLVAPDAKRVSVVGDFNDWNPATTPLEPAGGVWSHEELLSAGRHDYAFVIDGTRWIPDPAAPRGPADELGGGYSVLVAGAKP
jgi:1,4-alpha-glucan branching enzyme